MGLSRWAPHVLGLAAFMLLSGCDEDVVAVLKTDRPFTMYGVLNPLADTQFVRVFPLEGRMTGGLPEPLEAEFKITEMGTGLQHDWLYALLETPDGEFGHFYYWPSRVTWDTAYRLEITGSDGRSSFAEVKVPARVVLLLAEPDTTGPVRLTAWITGNPPHLHKSEVEVAVRYVVGFDPVGNPFYSYLNYTIPYDKRVHPSPEGRRFVVDLDEVYYQVAPEVQRDLSFVSSRGITLLLLRFRTLVASEAWNPPGGVFDPNVLIQPGVMSNVENGFGFIGAGYRLSSAWTLPLEVVEKSYFVPNR
jgi:hypothetical protein